MAIRIMFCPKCMNIIHRKDVKCTKCGLSVEKMKKMQEKKELEKLQASLDADKMDNSQITPVVNEDKTEVATVVNSDLESNIIAVIEGEDKKEEKPVEENEEPEKIDFKDFDRSSVGSVVYEDKNDNSSRKRHKHKSKMKDKPQYTVDEDGSFNIDTKDVTYLEGVEKPTQSVRKARGDAPKEEKLKWWEIYKWADRMLAKRKIMKEVKKASYKTPQGINQVSLGVLCLFFGWMGAHNFYARNYKKGWIVLAFDVIIAIVLSIDVLEQNLGISIIGGFGFIVTVMWVFDLVRIIIGKYKYRISKEEFISNLNVATRTKLGKKYVELDKTVFKAKEEARLNKIKLKKEKKLAKKKAKLENRIKK